MSSATEARHDYCGVDGASVVVDVLSQKHIKGAMMAPYNPMSTVSTTEHNDHYEHTEHR
jgi:hypothetical protein